MHLICRVPVPAAPGDAAVDDAHYAPGVRAARRGGPAARGQQETTKFSRPHPLQARPEPAAVLPSRAHRGCCLAGAVGPS